MKKKRPNRSTSFVAIFDLAFFQTFPKLFLGRYPTSQLRPRDRFSLVFNFNTVFQ